MSRLSEASIDRLSELVAVSAAPLSSGRGLLAELKSDPGKVSLETLLREVDKLAAVRALALPADLFADASDKLVDGWRARAARSFPSDLRDMPDSIRLTLLAALCWVRSAEITDALVDLLIELVHKVNTRADRRVGKELTADLRRVRGKDNVLFQLAEAAIDNPDDIVRNALYPVVGEKTLRELVREAKANDPTRPRPAGWSCAEGMARRWSTRRVGLSGSRTSCVFWSRCATRYAAARSTSRAGTDGVTPKTTCQAISTPPAKCITRRSASRWTRRSSSTDSGNGWARPWPASIPVWPRARPVVCG
ncbi:hypothetical protein [Nocardia lasii]|uniref:DUF222 domain-containing protein n=1 Tax=Nocardia lasii TaxID=1616107 RepID=A0ABW1JMY5_9NOCA